MFLALRYSNSYNDVSRHNKFYIHTKWFFYSVRILLKSRNRDTFFSFATKMLKRKNKACVTNAVDFNNQGRTGYQRALRGRTSWAPKI